MKNGKLFLLLGTITSVVILWSTVKKIKVNHVDPPTVDQLKNRLEEFCLFDIESAKSEFEEFINLGFNPNDAFELTIIKRVYV